MTTKPFSLLIKPASADCNLHCAYCFYREKAALYPETACHRMSDAVLERLIASYMATDQKNYTFGWQGGEPTLMGVEFFRRVVELQQKHGKPGSIVGNGLQTNAVLIDDEFAEHLAKYNFLLGVSIDGPAEIHDRYRTSAGGRGSHADVLAAIGRLNALKVEFNALTLVTSANVARAREVYDYLIGELGIRYHQYIPCVEFDAAGQPLPWTISGEQWGEFLCELRDRWKAATEDDYASVRLFDVIMEHAMYGGSPICHMGRDCCQYFVVEHNGDVYPCDFFVDGDKKLGNIMETSWDDLLQLPAYVEFGRQKSAWSPACESCDCLEFCAGDCLKHRLHPDGDPRKLSWLCAGWKQFYLHVKPDIAGYRETGKLFGKIPSAAELTAKLDQRRPISPQPAIRRIVGRNDPCPCGSGKKFKKCCGK